MTKISKETMVLVTELQFRAALARMVAIRGVEPSPERLSMMKGETEITLRDMGEAAGEYGFDLNMTFQEHQPQEGE